MNVGMRLVVNSLIIIDKKVRNTTPFKNIKPAVKVINFWSAYKPLGIGVCSVSTLTGLIITVIPSSPDKSSPNMTCVLVMYSFLTGMFRVHLSPFVCSYTQLGGKSLLVPCNQIYLFPPLY